MLSKTRGILLAFLLVMVSGTRPGWAQSMDDLLAAATQRFATASSYQFDFALALEMSGMGPSNLGLDLSGSGAIVQRDGQPAVDLDLNGSVDVGTHHMPAQFQARILDGVLYYTHDERPVWSGFQLTELTPIVENLAVSSFRSGFNTDAPETVAEDTAADPQIREALDALKRAFTTVDLNQFSTTERLADETVADEPTAHYSTTIAIGDLMASGEALNLIVGLLQLGKPGVTDGLSGAELNVMSHVVAEMFNNTDVHLDRYVSLDNGDLRRAVIDVQMAFDPTQAGGRGAPMLLNLNLDVQLDNINGDLSVSLPERTMIISNLADVLGVPGLSASSANTTANALPNPQPTEAPTPAINPNAQSIQANTPTVIELAPNVPTDLIYTAPEGDTINVIVRSLEEAGTVDPTVAVLSSDGLSLSFNDDNDGTRSNLQSFDSAIEALSLPAAGPYVIRVNSFSGAAEGRVEVTVESGNGPVVMPTTAPPVKTATAPEGQNQAISGEVPANGNYSQPFSGSAGQTVTLTVRAGAGTNFDPKLVLLGPDGTELAENDDHGTNDALLSDFDSQLSDFTLPATGEYTAVITGFAGSGGPFELTIDFGQQGINPPPATATPQTGQEQMIHGQVDPGSVFTQDLTVDAGDVYTITVRATNGDLDGEVFVVDASNNVIAGSDDHGSSDRTLQFTDPRLENYIFQSAGTYHIEVLAVGDTSGEFDLIITPVATDAPLSRPVETVTTGDLASGESSTVDFDAQAGQYVTITVRGLSGDMDPQVSLTDASGTVLAENDDHGTRNVLLAPFDAQIVNFPIPADGTYTVVVTGYQTTSGMFAITTGKLG